MAAPVTPDDRARFQALAAPLLDRLHFAALRLERNGAAAEDLAQEALLEAWRDFGRYDRARPVAPWLFRILETTFLDRRRRRRIEPIPLPEEAPAPAAAEPEPPPGDADAIRRALDDEMLRALDALPADQRTAVLYADVYGHSYAEIAEVQGAPIGTVRFRIHAGRARLRRFLTARRPA